MSTNVIRMPTAWPSDAGQSPAPRNPVAALIASIDQAIGENWSFDLVHHEVVGDETIVFTRLIVDGRHRIGIGGTTRQGPLVDRLNDAALDALTRAAAWMGIPTAAPVATPQPTTEPVPATPAESTARITRKQLDYAISLARDRGVARDRLTSHCLDVGTDVHRYRGIGVAFEVPLGDPLLSPRADDAVRAEPAVDDRRQPLSEAGSTAHVVAGPQIEQIVRHVD